MGSLVSRARSTRGRALPRHAPERGPRQAAEEQRFRPGLRVVARTRGAFCARRRAAGDAGQSARPERAARGETARAVGRAFSRVRYLDVRQDLHFDRSTAQLPALKAPISTAPTACNGQDLKEERLVPCARPAGDGA